MSYRSGSFLVTAALGALIALSGCTGGSDSAGSPGAARSKSTAGTISTVIAKQTFDATAGSVNDTDRPGGKVTATLRALEVSGKTMTLRWAFRWDNSEKPDDAATNMYELGMHNIPVLTDTANLKQYRPLCTKGSWQGGAVGQSECGSSVLVSPSEEVFFHFTNHKTVEAWAVFAAPQDDGAKVDALLVDGWPTFSSVTPTTSK